MNIYCDSEYDYFIMEFSPRYFLLCKAKKGEKGEAESLHRITQIQPFETLEEAEAALAQYANKNGLSKIEERG